MRDRVRAQAEGTALCHSALEMRKGGMLNPRTDVDGLVKRAFAHLDGVSDEWLQKIQVETVADGQVPKGQTFMQFSATILAGVKPACCHVEVTR